jgi:pyridoxal phosphate enzyme (YggS family)
MVKDNIIEIRKRISLACSKVDRDPGAITIVAVSKGRTPEQIRQAVQAGLTDIGENKVQEALLKHRLLSTVNSELSTIKWHMVGHLQSNKVKEAVEIFDLIQSVDSLRLAEEIDKQAARIRKIQDILIEVKTSAEESKFGLKPEETIEVIKEVAKFKNISIKGLMTIAPIMDNPQDARPYFRMLRELKDRINSLSTVNRELLTLSMGMTDDFEVAIAEGSNMVRIGRAIFGG